MTEPNRNSPSPEPFPVDPDTTPPEPTPIEPKPILIIPDEPTEEVEEPISLVESEDADGPSKVRALHSASEILGKKKEQFRRSLNVTGQGATRCRIFHARIALDPLEHMQQTINEWVDVEDLEIKHVGHVIGVMEGKHPEPNLIMIVWY